MSVVTGANVMLNADTFRASGSLGMLLPDSRSYGFDARANGCGRGEGVATVVVKRLLERPVALAHSIAVIHSRLPAIRFNYCTTIAASVLRFSSLAQSTSVHWPTLKYAGPTLAAYPDSCS